MASLRKDMLAEPALLLTLGYLTWGISAGRRFFWREITGEDLVDLLFTSFMVFSGYYLFKGLVQRGLARRSDPSPRDVTVILLVADLLVILWEAVLFTPYCTYYYGETLLTSTFPELGLPLSVLILIGLSLFFFQRWKNTASTGRSGRDEETAHRRYLLLRKGRETVQLPVEDVALFIMREKLLWVYNRAGERFLGEDSLRELEGSLEPRQFFRVNRQAIVARWAVRGYRPAENQKLLLRFDDAFPLDEPVTVSKYNAADFKKWLAHSEGKTSPFTHSVPQVA